MTDKIIEAVKEEYRTFAIIGVTKDGKYSDCYAPTSIPHNTQERMKSAIRTADKKSNEPTGYDLSNLKERSKRWKKEF